MSYIVAFVSFSKSQKEFPMQCFRTDMKSGELVVVRKTDGELVFAKIICFKYLNWDCNGQIECRKEECTININGDIVLPNGSPLSYGISSQYAFVKELKSIGWIPIKPKQRMYRIMLANLNSSSISYIFIRKNGLDIQIVPRANNNQIKPYSMYERSLSEGRVVRHSLAHTTFNLFEGILRFSKSFLSNEEDLDRYFFPQGKSDKRTEELKKQGNEMLDIYNACSNGDGAPAYLGDGMWITSSGRVHDRGR